MKKILFLLAFTALAFVACQQAPVETTAPEAPAVSTTTAPGM